MVTRVVRKWFHARFVKVKEIIKILTIYASLIIPKLHENTSWLLIN